MRDVPYAELRGLLLDLGNTLVGMDVELVSALLGAAGFPTTPEAFRRAEAAARPRLSAWIAADGTSEATGVVHVREILRGLGVDEATRAAAAPRLLERLRSVPTERLWSAVLPGVAGALGALRAAGLRLVVVSNSDGTAERGMVECGIRGLVDAVVDSAVFGAEKPDPRIFAHALERGGLRPHEVAHVGDLHAVDVVGAAAAGIAGVLVDPFGDWPDMGCATVPDLAALARRVCAAR